MPEFKLKSDYTPAGDQPKAIKSLVSSLNQGHKDQTLLGVTGSGKTFTMAHIINQTQRPALIMAHNKTLAAQLYEEFKEFFPENNVAYFVSYYDYYQPEAYVARTDTYIEKDASINEQIDRLRHAATRALFEQKDVIIIASVSCIYGIGDPESYSKMTIPLEVGLTIDRDDLLQGLVELQYTRNEVGFARGMFRAKGDVVEIFPSHLDDTAWRIEFFDDEIERISVFDPLTGHKEGDMDKVTIYPNSHYVTPKPKLVKAFQEIQEELKWYSKRLGEEGKLLEQQRITERTQHDLAMIQSVGYCSGIENYSRHLSGRSAGEAPPTLFDYLPEDALLFVDESHVTVPQIGGMFKGDRARKNNLVDFGFRLPSAIDNRPLKFEEWDQRRPQTVFVSATPAAFELENSKERVYEQVIRPTGLVDPEIEIRPVEHQVDDLMKEVQATKAKGMRTLVTTLTKKMSEQLTEYLADNGLKVKYLHSDIDALERVEIIRALRLGEFDVLVGINLLREGLDIPETGLVAILDADKEGFLRSTTSLIQTMGRAARNAEGRVILYADTITKSIKAATEEANRRREKQLAYNKEHGITPQSIQKTIRQNLEIEKEQKAEELLTTTGLHSLKEVDAEIESLRKLMVKAAEDLEFERAAEIRDKIQHLEKMRLEL